MRTTRRNVLKAGVPAVAASAALPFLFSSPPAQAQEDAELFALFAKYKRLEKVEIEATDKLHHAMSEAGINVSKLYWTKAELISRAYSGRAKELERSGLLALEKKHKAAVNATKDGVSRLYDARAHTPEGMILKLTIERTDSDRRSRRYEGRTGREQFTGKEYFSQGPSSVEMDVERLLSGRRI